jgi:O-antigen/teichoic acid export membrane protein
VRAETLPISQVRDAMLVVGAYLALLWPSAMLNTILAAAERQGVQNAIATTTSILRAVVTVMVLWWVEPTPRMFAAVQVLATLFSLAALAFVVRRMLPRRSRRSRFRGDVLRASWVTSASTVSITLLQIGISQTDRIVLSRTLPLAEFGVYSLACSLAANLHAFITPIYAAYFPRFCRSVGTDVCATRDAFVEGSRAMAIIVLPPAITLAVFSREMLHAWTGDAELADAAAGPLTALALGYAVAALHHVPQAMQYASGWLRPQILATGIATVSGTAWFALATRHVPMGVLAGGWLGMNVLILFAAAPIAVRRFAPGTEGTVAVDQLVVAVLVAAGVGLARLVPFGSSRLESGVAVGVGAASALLAVGVAVAMRPWGRTWIDQVRAAAQSRLGQTKTS